MPLPTTPDSQQPTPVAAPHAAAAAALSAGAQLLLWALVSPQAGTLRDVLWVVLAVALPPVLAVWGRVVLWALLAAGALLLLVARRHWAAAGALLLAGGAAYCTASWLGWGWQRPPPPPAPWPDLPPAL